MHSRIKYSKEMVEAVRRFGKEDEWVSKPWRDLWREALRRELIPKDMHEKQFRDFCRNRDAIPPRSERAPKDKGSSSNGEIDSQASLIRQNESLAKSLQKEKEKTATILEAMEASLVKVARLVPPAPVKCGSVKSKFDQEHVGLCIGDIQYGTLQSEGDVLGLAPTSSPILEERGERLWRTVEKIHDIHTTYTTLPTLHVFGLGDFIEGELIYSSQAHYIDLISFDQVFGCALMLAKGLSRLSGRFKEIRVYCVPGNHGRIGERKGASHWRSNLDLFVFKALSWILKEHRNLKFYLSLSCGLGVRIKEHNFMLFHGNEVRSWMNIPFYGFDRMVRRVASCTRVFWDYVIIGHHHQNCTFDVSYSKAIMNGSWVGASELSTRAMQTATLPKQLVFGLHDRWGVTWCYEIKLDARKGLSGFNEDGFFTPVEKAHESLVLGDANG